MFIFTLQDYAEHPYTDFFGLDSRLISLKYSFKLSILGSPCLIPRNSEAVFSCTLPPILALAQVKNPYILPWLLPFWHGAPSFPSIHYF